MKIDRFHTSDLRVENIVTICHNFIDLILIKESLYH